MARVHLDVYIDPGAFEISCKLRTHDKFFTRLTATVDTGAELSLFPLRLLNNLEHQIITDHLVIRQAGIARQEFSVVVAQIYIMFEDRFGNNTRWLPIPALFSETDEALIGFDGVLDRAVLYANLRDTTRHG